MEIKKKQHYVSQFYLKAWADNKGRVPTHVNGRTIPMKTKEVAHQNYFYRLNGITEKEHSYLTEFNKRNTPEVLINDIQMVIDISLAIGNSNHVQSHKNRELVRTNILEEIFCTAEVTAKQVIEKLLSQCIDSFTFEDYINLVRFCTLQMTRTSAARNNPNTIDLKQHLENKDIKFNDVYIITNNLILSEKLADYLMYNFYFVELIENNTPLKFITSDNPAINLNPDPTDTKVEIYYPISPNKAVILRRKDISEKYKGEIMDAKTIPRYFCMSKAESSIDRIYQLNTILARKSERFLFGEQDTDLMMYSSV
ncbi:DUF4238 domain-containing protein [Vibrio parahaemolyticus]|nr:DUF4238 domain-containing protein [Vibrio parahaemolyticus]EHK0040573.1 DUF4238 domain-containing protein [Vibrio parahaemolyticus]